jgi:alpha-galactosidase
MAFDRNLRCRIVSHLGGRDITLGPISASETITVSGKLVEDFSLVDAKFSSLSDERGKGSRLSLRGGAGAIEKTETVDSFENYPSMLFVRVSYTNRGKQPVTIQAWTSQKYTIDASPVRTPIRFWSLQSGSYESRPNWVVPLTAGFHRENYLGMNADDYGGGTPVIDVWRPDVGMAVGHDELTPQILSEPVSMTSADQAMLGIDCKISRELRTGEEIKTPETFVAVHQGDYFRALREYRRLMIAKGVKFENPAAGAYEPIWCAWGFGRDFRPEQIVKALPEAKTLGFGWVTMDDGWQTAEGDWQPNPAKFPRGDADVRGLVDKIHASGFKAQLWWAPLSVSPGSNLLRQHPEWLLLDLKGQKRKISWWNAYYLCPAVPDVVRYHQALAERIFKVWGFDGLKLDGQFLNAVPRCTNPAHHHRDSLDSVQELPYFFRAISEAAHAVKPDAQIELCPCGTAYSFFSMPYYNMSVASDPESSWQVRSKGKTLKALMGDKLPYFGDHVELSDGGADFASTVGVGGVIGTEYRWPPNDKSAAAASDGDGAKLILTPAKETIWAKWVRIYREQMLPKGEYRGDLYDIGFDKPETHCITKGANVYYAFFAPTWNGTISLRGLQNGRYEVINYVDGKSLGVVTGPTGSLSVSFNKSLLVKAVPKNS